MAILSSDGTYVTVQYGDTLTQIAVDYGWGYDDYERLATINNISNPELIYVGQIIKLVPDDPLSQGGSSSGSGSTIPDDPLSQGSSSSSYTSTYSYGTGVRIIQFGAASTDEKMLFITWGWGGADTDYFRVLWSYTIDGINWFVGSDSHVEYDEDLVYVAQVSTYNIPSGARQVKVKIKPVAKTLTDDDGNTSIPWTASWSEVKYWTVSNPLDKPDSPDVTIEKFKLTATLDNIEISEATHIEFQVVKDNSSSSYATKRVSIVSNHASYVFNIEAGGQYKVRCRAYSSYDGVYSEWSSYSDNKGTVPLTPDSITDIRALTSTSIYVSWTAVLNATGYTIEYTTNKIYFDSSNEVEELSVGEGITHAELTGLSTGDEYFVRVKATNSDGSSGWTDIRSVIIGKTPAAPTTWSSTTTAIVGETVTLYWVHNAEDGSSQTYAELQIYIGDTLEEHTVKYTVSENDEENENKTNSWELNTSSYTDGTSIKWRVRTAGITKEYGDWSIQRTIDVYAPATLQLSVTTSEGNAIDTLTSYPFYITALAGPKTQAPIGYHVAITSNEIYDTIDNIGNSKTVNMNEEVYARYFDISDPLTLEMTPSAVDLENSISYTVTCTVSMNSGLTVTESYVFTVAWSESRYIPNAKLTVNRENMTATIKPYCESRKLVYYQVALDDDVYTKTTTEVGYVWGKLIDNATTTTGERVYSGVNGEGKSVYYCMVEETGEITGLLLSVYRREFDGSFTEIATGLDSSKDTVVTDPHPALDYARYRIVATTSTTGSVGYYDPPGYPMNCSAVIIQWDEAWSSFETYEDEIPEQPSWSGSMLMLPYNIDVSESNSSDVSLIEYIGRSHPVTYYGTQLGVGATWNMEIPKSDKETLYGLRRLSRWLGDVYVREPSGSGYWANIAVSFSQKHCDVTIPVTLEISQVEGGM